MPKYLVTVVKTGYVRIDTETPQLAEHIARDFEASNVIDMHLEVIVELDPPYISGDE